MPKPRIHNEADVKAQVKKHLNRHDWFWWMPAANGYGTSGVSDFCAVRNGVFLAVETKFAPRKPTAKQIAFLNSIAAEDGIGLVVNDRNLDVFAQWLDLFDKSVAATSKGEKPPQDVGAALFDATAVLTQLIPTDGDDG